MIIKQFLDDFHGGGEKEKRKKYYIWITHPSKQRQIRHNGGKAQVLNKFLLKIYNITEMFL